MDVNELREARNKPASIFMRFCQSKKRYKDAMFCFYEGEDNKYYEHRVVQYTEIPYDNIISFDCEGKENVLKVYEMIKTKPDYDGVVMAFFTDRDYFESENKTDLYETPCYSVENFYTSINCFKKILKIGFGINVHEEDFEKCVQDFCKSQCMFHQHMIVFNAWLKGQREEEKKNGHRNVHLKNFKIGKLFETIGINIVIPKENINYDYFQKMFPDAIKLSEKRMKEHILFMKDCDKQKCFRGKQELNFLKKVIDDLVRKNNNGDYFVEKHNCVGLDPNKDTLLTLSQFADTPECLIEFLSKYKGKLVA